MADANSPVTDATPAPAPSSEAQSQAPVNTPLAEQAGSAQPGINNGSEQAIPYGRFREVISQKNEYAEKIEALERRLGAYETNLVQNRAGSVVDDAVGKLVAAGLDQNAAKLLVETQMALLDTRVSERISPLEQRAMRREVEDWIGDFSRSHADYKTLEPLMEREFAALPPQQQGMIASSPQGLEMLYWKVKGVHAQSQVQQGQNQGATNAYNNMAQKAAMTSTPGSPVPSSALTREAISKMSSEEYSKRRAEIFAALGSGGIK